MLQNWDDPPGYSTYNGDCNDSDPSISPWMTEQCLPANVDENCDGHTTFGAYPFNTYYADPDGDGFGEPTYLVEGCVAPLGYVQVDPTTAEADCNSSDHTTYPGAPEL